MARQVIHISEKDASKIGVDELLAHARAGDQVVIEDGSRTIAILQPAQIRIGRPVAESIALAQSRAKALGSEPVFDADFANDLEELIRQRRPRNIQEWE